MPVFRNLTRITEDNIEGLVPRRGGLLLLACLRREDGTEAAQAALARTGRWFDDLAVGFAGEDILAYLMERFNLRQVLWLENFDGARVRAHSTTASLMASKRTVQGKG